MFKYIQGMQLRNQSENLNQNHEFIKNKNDILKQYLRSDSLK